MVDPKIHISAAQAAQLSMLQAQKANLQQRALRQIEAREDFQDWADNAEFDGMARDFKSLEEQKHRHRIKGVDKKDGMEDDETPVVESIDEASNTASDFERGNPELKMKTLIMLRNRMKPDDTPETILRKVLEVYSDSSLADEALEFLLHTTGGTLKENVQIARDAFMKSYEREIKAGRNIAAEARAFSEQGLGSPTGLRDMYRDITGNPRDAHALFQELFAEYSYGKMKTVIDFMLHSLGADMKSKGPSISHAELSRLITDARTLASILGVYRFFKEREGLIDSQFQAYELTVPTKLTFEILAKEFMGLVNQRYISPDKVLQLARKLGVSEETAAQIIVFTQMRDGVRSVAPKLYRNNRHKDDTLKAIMEALEELEVEFDEEYE